ncbi:MAG: TonB-dependent receptor, partial [Saprospiraceae bacterium]|nr:TonB-dependent receptor [Saprospiraceae bacterium]
VTIKPHIDKSRSSNTMALVGSRRLNVQEASMYAGAFDDPARQVTAFAGIQSGVRNNAIIVRGQSPKYFAWYVEGVEIPNPNHFANLSTFGGGGLTALSHHLIADSDFYNGTMPAEYGNAISGVFDMKMRRGNNKSTNRNFQLGLIGTDVAMEGPLSKKSGASYLFNYRLSTLTMMQSLLPEEAKGTHYQDLSFKLNFPSVKNGVFSIWGIGLYDHSGQNAKSIHETVEYNSDLEDQDVDQYMGAIGINHTYFLNENNSIHSNVALTSSGLDALTRIRTEEDELSDDEQFDITYYDLFIQSQLKSQISARHHNSSGFKYRKFFYSLDLEYAREVGSNLYTLSDEQGSSDLIQAYTSSVIRINPRLSISGGFNLTHFTLNDETILEPRLSLQYHMSDKVRLGLGIGRHSRLEPLNYFFARDQFGDSSNTDMSLPKSDQFQIGMDYFISDHWHLKLETYYHRLKDVAIIPDSNFSFINLENDWFINHQFVSSGKGRNYGVDVTLERYLRNGVFGLLSTSYYRSEFQNNDEWFNSIYDNRFTMNLLLGKEWQIGDNNSFSFSTRFSYIGGRPHYLIDELLSSSTFSAQLITENGYTERFPGAFLTHFSINYIINKNNLTHTLSLKVLNATAYEEFEAFKYNRLTGQVDDFREAIVLPNLSYKVSF